MTPFALFLPDISENVGSGHFARTSQIYREWEGDNKCLLVFNENLSFLQKVFSNLQIVTDPTKTSISEDHLKIFLLQNLSEVSVQIQKLKQTQAVNLLIDSYQIDHTQELEWRPLVSCLIVLDDLANRKHVCDVLIDVALVRKTEDYLPLVPAHCKLLIGPQYCILSKSMRERRHNKISHEISKVSRVHIFMGGFDKENLTHRYLSLLHDHFPELSFNVVVSGAYPFWNQLESQYSQNPRVTLFKNVKDMGETLDHCDVALGAPGITTWERACLGVVGFYISTNSNQIPVLKALAAAQFCFYMGPGDSLATSRFLDLFQAQLADMKTLNSMRLKGQLLIDGQGISRVLAEINAS